MKQGRVASWGFFAVAILSMIAALVPVIRGGSMNVTFLGGAVVFFVIGVATARKAGDRQH